MDRCHHLQYPCGFPGRHVLLKERENVKKEGGKHLPVFLQAIEKKEGKDTVRRQNPPIVCRSVMTGAKGRIHVGEVLTRTLLDISRYAFHSKRSDGALIVFQVRD